MSLKLTNPVISSSSKKMIVFFHTNMPWFPGRLRKKNCVSLSMKAVSQSD